MTPHALPLWRLGEFTKIRIAEGEALTHGVNIYTQLGQIRRVVRLDFGYGTDDDKEVARLIAHAWAIPQLVEALKDASVWLVSARQNAMPESVRQHMNKTIENAHTALRAVEEETP